MPLWPRSQSSYSPAGTSTSSPALPPQPSPGRIDVVQRAHIHALSQTPRWVVSKPLNREPYPARCFSPSHPITRSLSQHANLKTYSRPPQSQCCCQGYFWSLNVVGTVRDTSSINKSDVKKSHQCQGSNRDKSEGGVEDVPRRSPDHPTKSQDALPSTVARLVHTHKVRSDKK